MVVAVVAISFDSSSCTRRDCSRSCDCNTDVHIVIIIIIIISAHTLIDCENLVCLRSGSCVLCGGLAFALVCIYGDSSMWVGCGLVMTLVTMLLLVLAIFVLVGDFSDVDSHVVVMAMDTRC